MKDKCLIFDMGGVLMEHDIPACIECFKGILGDNYPKLGLEGDGEGKELMEKFEIGSVDENEFIGTVLNWSREGTVADEIITGWNLMHAGIPQERISYLRRLKDDGYRLFLLSNSNSIHWKHICDNYNLDGIFDRIYLSFKEHCRKPDGQIFRLVQHDIGIPASDIVFIDDLKANRDAASILGWDVCSSIEELIEKRTFLFLPNGSTQVVSGSGGVSWINQKVS